jgi:hypothetical protein
MARPLGRASPVQRRRTTSTLPVATTSCPAVRIVRYERQHVLHASLRGRLRRDPATSKSWSSATKHCESTSARGTAIWRSRRASGSLSSFYMGLTTFTAKASCIAEDVGRVSGHAEHQRGVGDENFLGVDALGAAVGEGDVERGGRRGLVHLRSLSENPTGNHPGTLGSGPPSGSRSSLTALTFHTLGPGQPGQPRRMGGWATRAGND